MNESTAMSIFSWLGNHPVLSGLFIFFIALTESLAVVGLLVPGVVLMLIIGAYLATDQFSFSTAVVLTFAGAVAGDSISYYLGYHYKKKLITLWPISRYPETFEKGVIFFKRHGYKSIILGRFVGPLRALIPAIAGMFEMPRKHFFVSNVFSALVWAPVVLLPGYAIGISFEFAGDIASRLILLVVIVASVLWVVFWFIKSFYLYLLPRFSDGVTLLLHWSQNHPLPGKVPTILLEKKYSDKNIFSILFALYIFFSLLFFALPTLLGVFEQESEIDYFLKSIFLNLYSPGSNQFIIKILNLLDLSWMLLLSGFTLLIIIWKKHAILFRYYLFTFIVIGLLQIILNQYLKIDHNNNLFGINVYLFLTFVLTYNSTIRRKILYYGICYALMATLLIAQLYHGSANLTPLLLGNLFSLLWIIILTSTYRHHSDSNKFSEQFQRKIGFLFLTLLLINVIFLPSSFHFKQSIPETLIVEKTIWINYLSDDLPIYRKGLIEIIKHPFNIQWSNSKSTIIKKINSISISDKPNWKLSTVPQTKEILQFLNPNSTINSLAIFPQIHNGVYEQLRFTQSSKNEMYVLRLWKTNYKIKNFNPERQAKPLWLGTLTKLTIVKRAGIKILQSNILNELQFQKISSKFKLNNSGSIFKYRNVKDFNRLLLSY